MDSSKDPQKRSPTPFRRTRSMSQGSRTQPSTSKSSPELPLSSTTTSTVPDENKAVLSDQTIFEGLRLGPGGVEDSRNFFDFILVHGGMHQHFWDWAAYTTALLEKLAELRIIVDKASDDKPVDEEFPEFVSWASRQSGDGLTINYIIDALIHFKIINTEDGDDKDKNEKELSKARTNIESVIWVGGKPSNELKDHASKTSESNESNEVSENNENTGEVGHQKKDDAVNNTKRIKLRLTRRGDKSPSQNFTPDAFMNVNPRSERSTPVTNKRYSSTNGFSPKKRPRNESVDPGVHPVQYTASSLAIRQKPSNILASVRHITSGASGKLYSISKNLAEVQEQVQSKNTAIKALAIEQEGVEKKIEGLQRTLSNKQQTGQEIENNLRLFIQYKEQVVPDQTTQAKCMEDHQERKSKNHREVLALETELEAAKQDRPNSEDMQAHRSELEKMNVSLAEVRSQRERVSQHLNYWDVIERLMILGPMGIIALQRKLKDHDISLHEEIHNVQYLEAFQPIEEETWVICGCGCFDP
ncbi:hypothetical protein AK830_g7034 [Neonectria ditissima]|uniref:Uncharacterized protein n=1 Tax=Neonectria ditissima TaxID=78410 RepID=A0A0P7BB41_9HYPO|nr:hypothetical protein AK830_g7034 [Neonectria ditissima]